MRLEAGTDQGSRRRRVSATLAGGDGRVTVRARIAQQGGVGTRLMASIAGVSHVAELAEGADEVEFRLTVPTPQIWWPHHLGAQPLYPLQLELRDSVSNDLLDSYSKAIGFRSVRLDTAPDEHGSAFTFVINDVPLFLCGANWIPDDCFPPRVTAER